MDFDVLFHWIDKMFLRENLHDFVSNKREMFFLQYALAVKQKEIEKLEKSVQVRSISRIILSSDIINIPQSFCCVQS